MECIGHDHYIYGNSKEIEEYARIRESGTPIKSVKILSPGEEFPEEDEIDEKLQAASILDTPIHDTGSIWYALLSFLCPIGGLIAGAVFRKRNYIRNFKMCRKGALIGLGVIAALVLLFGIGIILALI